jgi:hypothetical protein
MATSLKRSADVRRARRRATATVTALVLALGAVAGGMTKASADRCITFGYDGTGNRTSMTTAAAAANWGAATWGCLVWTP